MRSVLLTALLLISAALFATFSRSEQSRVTPLADLVPSQETASVNAPLGDSYPVVKVVDGDTLVVNINGVYTTLRLIGLDTPETVDPRKEVQCFGKEASDRAKALLSGKTVRLEYDPSQGTLDKYGRTLAYLYMEDGTPFNRYMIAEGYGHEYTYNLPYKYQAEFKAAEADAREGKKGLWAEGVCADGKNTRTIIYDSDLNGGGGTRTNTAIYECSRNAYNCSDFKAQADAQAVYSACGPDDIHKLDSDGDGEVCESLP